jgi:zinc protease
MAARVLFDDVKRKVLDNGLEILVREDASAPVVALNFFVRVGSLNEDEAIAGWSHGIEHMLFKGTARRGPGDIAREIANAGGETNAGTGYESTNYHIVLPSRNFETALDIHADVLRNSTFDPHELEKERHVLIKENEMYRDRPSGFGVTWESLLAAAFTTHRYQRPIGGPDENLLRVGREAVLAHKERYYVPNNITYVVVGDVRASDVFRAMEAALGSWPRQDLAPDVSLPEPAQRALRYAEGGGDVANAYVKIGFHVPPELDPETDALMVLCHILGSGRSSRLYRRVREDRGLILDAGTMESTGREPGYLAVEFEAKPEMTASALDAVMTEILRFRREPVAPAEIERTLRALRNESLHTLETMEGQARILGHYALLGDYRLAGGYLERMAGVTPERIRDAARRRLSPEQATVFVYGPRDRKPPAADAAALAARFAGLETGNAPAPAPAGPAFGGGAPLLLPTGSGGAREDVEALRLDAGTRVLLQRDGRLPLVALAVFVPVGSGSETADAAGVTAMTQSGMMKGAGGRSAADIDEALERLGARMRPFANRDLSGFSLGAVRDDLDAAFDLFRTVLTRPDFPEAAIARERERTLAEIAAVRDDTVQFTVQEFFRLLFPDQAYGRPTLGTADGVGGLTRDRLAARRREMYDPARMIVSAVGDFDRDRMLARLDDLVAAFPKDTGPPPAVAPVSHPTDPVNSDLYQDVSQAVVVLGYPGPRVDAPDRYALDVWNTVMSGMGNRLFTTLRDENHLCYFTGTFVAPFINGGAIGAYIGTGPDLLEPATEGLLSELARSARELPTDEEILRAKNTLAGSYWIGLQSRMAWAATYAQDEALGLGYRETLEYLDRIRAVTPEQVRDCAVRSIDDARRVTAVLRPSGDAVTAPAAEA